MRISDWSSDVCSSDLHVRLPEIDARLDAEFHFSFSKRFKKRAVGQEYFVYKIYISDARGDQAVDLLQHDVQIPPPVAVAKIDLGAKAALIGAAACIFHLRARAAGLRAEAVVVRQMAAQPVSRKSRV